MGGLQEIAELEAQKAALEMQAGVSGEHIQALQAEAAAVEAAIATAQEDVTRLQAEEEELLKEVRLCYRCICHSKLLFCSQIPC